MAPAAALPVRVESTPVALGPVAKAPVSVCVESVAPQPLPSTVGTLVTKVVPVTALPKLSGPRLPAPQIVTVKTPGTTTIQLPANLQLPPVILPEKVAAIKFALKSVVALRQLLPNSQSFIENCVQELSGSALGSSKVRQQAKQDNEEGHDTEGFCS
ncbi:hypothetical protein A6R68_21895, partial [Neotoma lepida]